MVIQGIALVLDTIAFVVVNNARLKYKEVGKYELKIGYKDNLLCQKPLLVDMKKTPHLFISGLCNSGKSKMVEYAVQGKQVALLNAFEDDFKTIQGERIIGNQNMLNYLNKLLDSFKTRSKDAEPLYIVIDELLVLCINKAIVKAITDLLAIARHYNVYLIGISQAGTKDSVPFKHLFNCRVCFRQVEQSSYHAILGFTPENTKLRQREFYLYSDDIYRGYTYTIRV